jgi:acyl-coenzyme A synthetase/AMP-(fatty) acid ligase
MTDTWRELIHGERWRSPATLWVEDGTEYSWQRVSELATAIEGVLAARGTVRVLRIRSASKLGCFAGQLAAWRAGCVAVADDGNLGPDELERVRPDLTVSVGTGGPESVSVADERLPVSRIPDEVVAVNFTSGSTGSRRAVAVTRGNLLALFTCRGLAVPARGGPTAGSFATPTYDGWWFDTWRTAFSGGTVVCLPNVNEDVFAWPELVEEYGMDRLLLPAAVVATLLEAVPEAVAGIPWVFSGGEQFQVSTCQRAREAGLANRFVNLYGPTEATFATHRYVLPDQPADGTVPIGSPLDGCVQRLRDLRGADSYELVVEGPFVCLGYLESGVLADRFGADGQPPSYPTGDVVRVDDDGHLVFAGRLDSQIKVNGTRVDAAALEHEVTRLPGVSGCRVAQHERHTVAFAAVERGTRADGPLRTRVETLVRHFSSAIAVAFVERFPVRPGGKVDTAALVDHHFRTTRV